MERFDLSQRDLPFFRTLHSLAFRQLGLSKESVMDLKDIKEFADFNSVYETKFGSHKPARSTIEVASLPLNSRVEIEAVAEISNLQE